MQAFECHGLWTLPNQETPPVAGTLRVSSNGELRLSVIGSLGCSAEGHGERQHPIILGSVEGPLGNKVTLTDSFPTKLRSDLFAEVRSEQYLAQRGFFGVHLRQSADLTFRRLQLRVGGLRAWTHSLSGFREGGLQGGVHEKAPLLYYAMPVPVGGTIPGGEISVGFSLTRSGTAQGYTFSEEPSLIVTCDTPLSDEAINQRFIYPLQNLMTFVCDRAQEVEQVSLWREDVLVPTGANPEIRLIGARVYPEAENESTEFLYPHQLLFTLADIEDGFAAFVERWLRLTTAYADACNIFFGLRYGPPAYLDIAFLGIMQSLCLYYTRRAEGIVHRTQEEERLREILTQLSSADAEWVRGRIGVRPCPPPQDILAKLLVEHSELMTPLLQTGQPGFLSEVMNTFHYTVRRDSEVGPAASHGADLYWMTEKLHILLKLCFLRELEFSAEKIRSLYQKNRVYQHLCQLVSSQQAAWTH